MHMAYPLYLPCIIDDSISCMYGHMTTIANAHDEVVWVGRMILCCSKAFVC